MSTIFREIAQERAWQKSMWSAEHDQGHSDEEWIGFIDQRLRTLHEKQGDLTPARRRALYIVIAALAFAAIEASE